MSAPRYYIRPQGMVRHNENDRAAAKTWEVVDRNFDAVCHPDIASRKLAREIMHDLNVQYLMSLEIERQMSASEAQDGK
jgi:hypothetical protein